MMNAVRGRLMRIKIDAILTSALAYRQGDMRAELLADARGDDATLF
jgi:hypothetical protein